MLFNLIPFCEKNAITVKNEWYYQTNIKHLINYVSHLSCSNTVNIIKSHLYTENVKSCSSTMVLKQNALIDLLVGCLKEQTSKI